MKKFFTSLVALAMVIVSQGQVQAQPGIIGIHGYGGLPYGTWLSCNQWLNWLPWLTSYPWLTVPGCEAQMMLVRQNQAMLAGFAQQAIQPTVWPYPGWPGAPQYQPPVAYQPTGQQYIVVRVPKSRGHKWGDIGGASTLGAAIVGGATRSWEGAAYGALGGFGGGILYTQHEYDSYAVPLSTPPQPPLPQQQPTAAPVVVPPLVQPSTVPRVIAPTALSGVPMVIVNESELWIHVQNETTGKVFVILGPKTEAPDLTAPEGRLRFYVITPQNGVMTRQEIVPEPDQTLPGWRIPPKPIER